MELTFRDIDYSSMDDCLLLAKWYNDPEIKHLYSLFTDAESLSFEFTPDYFQRVGQMPRRGGPYRDFMVLADGVPIGEAKLETDTPKLITKTPHTAWVALMIGDASLRRQRLGSRILSHLEDSAIRCGVQRIEIGVFEFNERALSFFKNQNYVEFDRREQRVYWDGRMWDDIRLLKTL